MNQSGQPKQAICPSSKCQEGALLLGIVKEDGHIDMLHRPIAIDKDFVGVASQGRLPEMRFRFANKCIKNGCKQWTGTRCGIIDKILDHVEQEIPEDDLPPCSIRPECRWFNQNGADACKVCPFVITDVTEMEG